MDEVEALLYLKTDMKLYLEVRHSRCVLNHNVESECEKQS